jgi:hypothetical protein
MADWFDTAAAELDRLTGVHVGKKRATILALVDARISGRSEETVWSLPETCNRSAYYKWRKEDPIFFDVLTKVTGLARTWKDGAALRALAQAAERLALASPVAVARAIAMLQSGDDRIVLQAAFGILDRAGVETAVKSRQEVTGKDGGPQETRIEIVYADVDPTEAP